MDIVDLSIVIVNWNVRDLLRRCLESLVRESGVGSRESSPIPTPYSLPLTPELIVVDNASTDGSAEMVRTEFPDVQLIVNTENRGFPAANNQGIAVAQGRYVLLLNPDTEVVGGALATLVAFADTHPDVGIVGPQLLYPDGSVQPSRRRFPTLATGLLESTWLQPAVARLRPNHPLRRVLDRYYVLDRPADVTQDVDWLYGAALLVRRQAIAQVGLMDEGYFMYSEELDWCRRFRAAGWRVVYLPTARIIHYEGKSSEQVLPARHIHFQTSKVRYFRKYHGRGVAELLRLFLLGSYAWQWMLEGGKWLLGHKRPLRAARLAAYGQVLRSGLRERGRG